MKATPDSAGPRSSGVDPADAPGPSDTAQPEPGRGTWRRERETVVLHAVDSPTHVPEPFAIALESGMAEVPLEFEPHAHPLHELVWVCGGTMTVRLADRVLTIPQGQGLWIPAGVRHAGRMTARTELCDALFDPGRTPVAFPDVTGIAMTPVLESLLTYLDRGSLEPPARLRAEAVVFDLLEPSARPIALQVPGDGRIAPIVSRLVDDPADATSLSEWADALGVSERTVTRVFRQTTGLSFVQWRQVLRVHRALALMAEGLEVQVISERLGYAQPSTFIASFRRVMGTTPGGYLSENTYRLA